MSVNSILVQKSGSIPTISADASVRDVLQGLEENDVGALIISDDGTTMRGIISERDVVRGLRTMGDEVLDATVSDLMTTDVITCSPNDQVALVRAMMAKHHIRHIPVLDNDRLVGLLSIRDIIQNRLDEIEAEAEVMRGYISGRY